MIALILGGAPSVWSELAEAQALLNRRHIVVAANLAGIHFAGHLDGWATLHPDLLPDWAAERAGNASFRPFTPDTTPERWPGSSGLYALQVALFEMGATAAILCGVPMDSEAGHFTGRERWESVTDYRQAFAAALSEIGGRTRSMGGWTRDLFGAPSAAWIAAVDIIRPLGASRPQHQRTTEMHSIKNVSNASQRFNARRADGQMVIARLAPGERGEFEADVNQAVFARGFLSATEIGGVKAPAAPRKAAPRKAATAKAATAKPAAAPASAADGDA